MSEKSTGPVGPERFRRCNDSTDGGFKDAIGK